MKGKTLFLGRVNGWKKIYRETKRVCHKIVNIYEKFIFKFWLLDVVRGAACRDRKFKLYTSLRLFFQFQEVESFTSVFYAYNKKVVWGNSIWQDANGFVAGGEAVLIHVDYGPVSMQVGALYAERLGYLLGRHVDRNVDRKVNLVTL